MNIRSRSDGTKYPVHGRSLFSNPARNRTFQRDIHFGDESEARRSVTFADEYWESHPSHHDRSRLVLAMNEARNRARVGSKNERLSPEERERYREAEARLTSWIDAHKGKASSEPKTAQARTYLVRRIGANAYNQERTHSQVVGLVRAKSKTEALKEAKEKYESGLYNNQHLVVTPPSQNSEHDYQEAALFG